MKEADLARIVIAHLRSMHWEVYQEVELARHSRIADIVGLLNGLTWEIECKGSLSLTVIGQARDWSELSHFTSIAIPSRGRSIPKVAWEILRTYGIGLMLAGPDIYTRLEPRLNRHAPRTLRDGLREEHKTWAEAGNSESRRYTPFADTCRQLEEIVRKRPGITLRESVELLKHHYHSGATARSCLRKWIDLGKVPGVQTARVGKKLVLLHSEVAQ